jgi:hypothetical protein
MRDEGSALKILDCRIDDVGGSRIRVYCLRFGTEDCRLSRGSHCLVLHFLKLELCVVNFDERFKAD